ncbi:armadillo repeat-containing protein 2 isoform x1 [Limosa lapponica baueri]|uniref:Armadillo repeat-containing protein 2 isoform x1 n=1 Tax=Limosa lapponica baueri TaxID=1758121 RepID=A0A2I0UJ27_LIMLA|nr:armadillo repeat-containing protein 2 isoform x1 [Limosa lapponica baueri]
MGSRNLQVDSPLIFLYSKDQGSGVKNWGEKRQELIGMQPSKDKNTEKAAPFYRLSVPKKKTSSEIINEARNVLRTLRTRRPFTPTEDQRKLFGSGSSRAPRNRPPSVFSLHASSFDLAESRPVSGVRLSPLDHKPELVTFAKDEDFSISFPKPPADAAEVRKLSSARARFFRRTSQGNFLSAKMVPPDQNNEKLDSEEPAVMNNLCRSSNNCLAEQRSYTPFNDESRQLICNEHVSRSEREDSLKGTTEKFLFQLRGESDQMKKPDTSSSWPRGTDWKRRVTGSEDETRINESEEEEIFWHIKVLPILHELEKVEDNIENLCLACTELYQALNEGNMLGKRFKRRSALLKILYKLVDIDSDPLCLKLAKIILAVTATLRNVADLPPARRQLICSGAVSELCVALEQRMNDKDVCTYIVRIFSKLSSYNDFCAALADCSRCYILFLALLNKHQKQQDLVIRIIFILGNLTEKNNQAREQFFKERGSVNTLISLFQIYHELDLDAQKWYHERGTEEKNHPKHPSEAEDVLIKLIRVLANLSIHPSVGAALAAAHRIVELLITVLEYKSVDDCEELVINAATTINNLSYYKMKSSAVQDKKLHIAEMLLKLLMSNNMDGVVEAVRVFGNLSQYHEICDFIMQKKIYKFMIALLDAKNQDVCFSACGVLLNLTVDKKKRALLMEEGGIGKLVDCLQDFGPADWQLACLICKTLWNYSENITSAASCFGEDTDTLLVLLTSLLDEELALDHSLDTDLRDYNKLYWEREFKPVAEKLLDRIQRHHSCLPAVTITPF